MTNFATSVGLDLVNTNAQNAQNAQSFYAQSSSSLQQATSITKSLNEKQNSINYNLIYKPYAIFPEGHIYKGENPGSLGYKEEIKKGFAELAGEYFGLW